MNSLTIGWGNLAENSQIWLLYFQPSLFLTTSSELNCLKSMPPYCLYLSPSPSLNLHKIKAARNKCHTSKEQRTCFKCKPSIKVRIITLLLGSILAKVFKTILTFNEWPVQSYVQDFYIFLNWNWKRLWHYKSDNVIYFFLISKIYVPTFYSF